MPAVSALVLFLSTLSLRRATPQHSIVAISSVDFYPCSPCGERLKRPRRKLPQEGISIHALLAESDLLTPAPVAVLFWISIHALLAESDGICEMICCAAIYFYPRSPCGERLFPCVIFAVACQFLSTLSLRRATTGRQDRRKRAGISIHALLAESDLLLCRFLLFCRSFLSTLSLRRATWGAMPCTCL